jgi:predicted negative regulator of RcsB-dependent stress response
VTADMYVAVIQYDRDPSEENREQLRKALARPENKRERELLRQEIARVKRGRT